MHQPDAPLAPVQPEQDAANLPLNDDLFALIFNRVGEPASLIRCRQVCRRFYHVISSMLRTGPFFLGFYHVPNMNLRLPKYVHCEPHFTNSNLDLTYLNSVTRGTYTMYECRDGLVLLSKMVRGHELHFVLASPFGRSSMAVQPVPPPLYDVRIHRLVICAYVPWTPQPNEEYKIIVVFSDRNSGGAQFTTMGFSSLTHTWLTVSHNNHGGITFPKRGYQEGLEPTVFAGRMIYKLQSVNYILAVDPTTLMLSKIDLPIAGRDLLGYGNHSIGRTEEDNLCFFMIRKTNLYTWVYRINDNIGQWFLLEIVDLNRLMDRRVMGEVADMRFSADIGDQGRGFRLMTLNGFAEASGILILVMADWVVSYEIKTKSLVRLWYSHDMYNRVQVIYPYEMKWPPVPMRAIGGVQGA